jgi:large subunit ribosomal protein L2
VFNVEVAFNHGGIIARAAGTFCTILRKTTKYIALKLPSQEVKQVSLTSLVTIGKVANRLKKSQLLAKAGMSR